MMEKSLLFIAFQFVANLQKMGKNDLHTFMLVFFLASNKKNQDFGKLIPNYMVLVSSIMNYNIWNYFLG